MPMSEEKITQLCHQITASAWAFSDGLISMDLCLHLKNEIDQLYLNQNLVKSKIGSHANKVTNNNIRGDYIYWLEENLLSDHQIQITSEIAQIGSAIKQQLFMNFDRLESHFALYPAGSRYVKHLDKTILQNTRFLTFILFLNDKWEKGHGGELSIYKENDSQVLEVSIEPQMGRLVFFLSSQIYHEVLVTHQPRYSLTGWFNQSSPLPLVN